jgi:SH3 domain-containing protein/zinc ribbon protein
MIICSQCGNAVDSNQTFCIECGTQVQKGTSAVSVPSTQPSVSAPEQQVGVLAPSRKLAAPSIQPQPKQPFTPMIWILVPIGVLVLLIVVVAGVKLSSPKETGTFNTNNTNSQVRAASPAPNYYPAARVVTCRFNGVNVRDAPNLNATIITEIQQGHVVNVIRESSNLDTVMIRSLNREVTDNWSEVQLENTPYGSVHGWIFSGFLR